ncbi:hypothetical protein H5410_055394 [Solanum commersonii]|uniref:AAA+ ATPase domain-containing protein n=1 Tax=Solanum commersonii TaxID=4109 RepID=A0A9J5WJ71_SOLCO|nr:hypothetical protein H5410_055394 [Solanum commersonii]
MPKRGRSVGRGPLSVKFRRRIVSCKNNCIADEELVDHLRKSFRADYYNLQLQPFTGQVQNIFQLINPPIKKPKTDSTEQILDGDGELSTLASISESDDSYSCGEKPDLMQIMLRNTYNQKANSIPKSKKIEYDANSISKSIFFEYDVIHDSNEDGKGKKIDVVKRDLSKLLGIGDSDRNGGTMFKDLGGMDEVLEELKMDIMVPLYHPQETRYLGIRPVSGVLFHGPPGCGKTKLAHAIANEARVPFYKLSATELVSGVSGEIDSFILLNSDSIFASIIYQRIGILIGVFSISGASEENIRELFLKAHRTAPSIVFIDEIDAIASKRENAQREMERRIVTQLMTCMDESHRPVKPDDNAKGTTLPTDKKNTAAESDDEPGYVLVIGATNRPDAIDPALRRPGRFDREYTLGIPDENARMQILSVLTRNLRVEGAFDLMKIATSTPGFVGADLASLTNKAGNLVLKRIMDARKVELSRESVDGEVAEEWWRKPLSPEEKEKLSINMADFEEAAKLVQPSSRREGFSVVPNVKWEDVGGLDPLRHEFELYIVRRIKNPKDYMYSKYKTSKSCFIFHGFGVDLETGFLLYGPPGCGKTLIAKAVANEAGANFIHIKGPEVLNKFVGQSELNIRTIFNNARTCSPCIVFFDEMDSLTTERDKEETGTVERILTQLLTELDGGEERKGVYLIGATNRPNVMDKALLRPGRLGRLLYVPLPTPDQRVLILKALARKKPIDSSVNLVSIGRDNACKRLSGADLSSLMNEAAMLALEDTLAAIDTGCGDTSSTIKESHFRRALKKISLSVSNEQIKYYKDFRKDFRAA